MLHVSREVDNRSDQGWEGPVLEEKGAGGDESMRTEFSKETCCCIETIMIRAKNIILFIENFQPHREELPIDLLPQLKNENRLIADELSRLGRKEL